MEFERHLEDNLFTLYDNLSSGAYCHGPYHTFHIYDPKHRIISKATVRDRVVHHLVFKELYRIFNPSFIFHSYSSRESKGTHLAVRNLARALRAVSKNYTHPCFALKCDIRRFFDSVPHGKLMSIIQNKTKDSRFLRLTEDILGSFSIKPNCFGGGIKGISHHPQPLPRSGRGQALGQEGIAKGLPIGNVTSQIFANIYLNELDQFVKHGLKVKHYFRYADDFVIVHENKDYLADILAKIDQFLQTELILQLHPRKVEIRPLSQGIDFLGYVILPHHIVLRTKTKWRMFRKLRQKYGVWEIGLIDEMGFGQTMQSYLGMLKHCDGYDLENILKNSF